MNRELTPFFCKELLPSHLEGVLDPERKRAVEDMLKKDAALKKYYEKMQEGIQFLEGLSEIEPREELVNFVQEPHGFWRDKLEKYAWKKWPETLQWSAQLGLVGVLVMVTVRFVPWLNLAQTFQNAKPGVPLLQKIVNVEDTIEVLKPRPIYGPEWPKSFPPPEVYAKQQAETKKRNQALVDIVAKTDEEMGEHGGTDADDSTETHVQRQGYVWRGVVKVEELNEEISKKVTDIIVKLGGKKAGQVELGWKKGDSRYFHFTIPEASYTDFNQSLQEMGQIHLTKEKHPRVMSEGTMRVIMSLEAGP